MSKTREQAVQNSEYLRRTEYNSRVNSLFEGNAVRQPLPLELPEVNEEAKRKREAEIRERRRRLKAQARLREQQKRLKQQQRLVRMAAIAVAAVLVTATCFIMLKSVVRSNELTNEIADLESQLSDITAQNDSREYEIDSSVDLNEVLKIATEDLGMVRSSAGQIVTYEASDDEYVQQIAEIPE